jgi:hypothetical protein
MANLVSILLFYGLGGVAAFSIAWLFTKLTELSRNRLEPAVGSILRLRATSGVYRSQLMSVGSVWTISAPLQRDHHVPLRVGENLHVEAASKHGAILGRSLIVARQSDPHVLVLKRPEKLHLVERRQRKRWPEWQGAEVSLDGQSATLMNLSEGGARVQTSMRTYKGDRLRLDMPWGQEVHGWVLSSEGDEARIRFEELIDAQPVI